VGAPNHARQYEKRRMAPKLLGETRRQTIPTLSPRSCKPVALRAFDQTRTPPAA